MSNDTKTQADRIAELETENLKLAEKARLWRDSAYQILSDAGNGYEHAALDAAKAFEDSANIDTVADRQTIDDLESFIEIQKGTIRLARDEYQVNAAHIAALKDRIRELTGQNSSLHSAIVMLKNELRRLAGADCPARHHARIAELEANIDEVSQDMAEMAKEMRRERAYSGRLRAKCAALDPNQQYTVSLPGDPFEVPQPSMQRTPKG